MLRSALLGTAALAAIAALAGGGSAGARPAGCTPAAVSGPPTYSYAVCRVADLDQRRVPDAAGNGGLPNDGRLYCVPTTTMDLLTYLAANGYVVAPPVKDWELDANFNQMSSYIQQLGGLMDTDPDKGTNGGGFHKGLSAWFFFFGRSKPLLAPYVVKVFRAGERFDPSPANMAIAAINGALVLVNVGHYKASLPGDRTGGHAVALVQAKGPLFSAGSATIGVHDPNTPTTEDHQQSAYTAETWTLAKKTVAVGPISFTFWSIDDSDTKHYDGYTLVEPEIVFTDPDSAVTLDQPVRFNQPRGKQQPARTFKANGPVSDLAVAPEGFVYPYLTRGSDTVWQLDTVTGQSTKLADGPAGASRLTFGGPALTLFVAGRDELITFDRTGKRLRSTRVAGGLDAIAYNDGANRLVGLSLATHRLVFFSDDLKRRGTRALPRAVLAGRGSPGIAVTAQGAVLVHRDRRRSVFVVPARSPERRRTIALRGVRNPVGLAVDDRGHVFVAENGRLVDFLPNGVRYAASPFRRMPADGFVHVSRSYTNVPSRTLLDDEPPEDRR